MKYLLNLCLALLVIACSQPKSNEESSSETEVAVSETVTPSLEKLWESDTILSTSESVLYDYDSGILYVSCINGVPPAAQDEDGFIAKVSPEDGSVIELKWVTGLDAPKGMALFGNNLYVTNIDEIVIIDKTSGEITKRIPVEGAQFLNDATVDSYGNVYFSDSNTNKIHMLSQQGVLSTWLESESLGGPNGLYYMDDILMLATFGEGNFKKINMATSEIEMVVDSIPGGDGVEMVDEKDFLVSNWNGEVYYVTADWTKTKLLDTKEAGANAADIEYHSTSKTVFVPTFFGNQVVAYKLNN